jgi:hypothetical protein
MSDNKTLPLKLKDSDGNLQQISATETNFVAYLASLQTAQADSSDVGLLTLSASGNRLIGSFVDTYYPEPVGTHPYDLTSIVTTTTNLYQINGTASEADSDWRKPVGHFGGNVYEMSDTDFNSFVDTVNGRIALSDYPGTLQLSATRPSSEYEILIPSVFTDQRADSAGSSFDVNDYHIWRRTSMTAPTSIRDDLNGASSLVGVKRSNGDSGDYQGLTKLTDRQIQVTVGQRAKTRRSIDGNIGSYDLRTSSEGAPVAGTWKSVGSATNTIRDIGDVNYTRTRSSAYTRNRASTYTDDYARTRSSTFAGNYIGNYSRDFSGNYTRDFIGNYLRPFVGNYSRTFVGNYSRDRVTNFVGNYVGNYSRTFSGNFSRNFTGNYSRNFAGNFIGDYTRLSTRIRTSIYSRTRISTYVGNYIGDFIGEYARTVSVDYTADYTRTRATNFTDNFSRQTISTYTSFFTRQTLAGNFTRTRVSSYQRTGGYLGEYGRTFYFAGNFTGNYTRTPTYTGDYGRLLVFARNVGNFIDIFTRTGNYTRVSTGATEDYTRVSTRTSTAFQLYARTRASVLDYSRGFVGDYVFPGFTAVYSRTAIYVDNVNFVGDYVGNFVGNYVGNNVLDFVGNYSRNVQVDYTRTTSASFVGNYSRNFAGEFTGNYTRTSTRTRSSAYSRTRTSTYITNRASTYSQDYSATYAGNFIGNYSRNRVSAYARTRNEDYTRTRNSAFTRTRSSSYSDTYTRNRSSTFAGNYGGNYVRSFAGNYSRNFIGNYAGQTIEATSSAIETYTLYVRTA